MKTLKLSILLLLSFVASSNLLGQTCSPGTITTQAQITDIGANCTIIDGDLIIEGAGINDLDPLFTITEVTGDVIVQNCPNLTTLVGLDQITTIGGDFRVISTGITTMGEFAYILASVGGELYIEDNNALLSLSGLNSLVSIGDKLSVRNCSSMNEVSFTALETIGTFFELFTLGNLQNINFPNLNAIGAGMTLLSNSGNFNLNGFPTLNTIADGIQLAQNNGLKQVNGFHAVTTCTAIFMTTNDFLEQVNGFGSLTATNALSITGSSFLTQLNGFGDLESTGFLEISGNGEFASISGFGSLSNINGDLEIIDNLVTARGNTTAMNMNIMNSLETVNGSVTITGNNVFTNISGFSGLESAVNITIENNTGLTSISGFGGLNSVSNVISIDENPNLTSISGLQALTTVSDHVNITDNPMLSSIGSFNSVATGDFIFDNNDALTTISGFNNHTNGGVVINNHAELTSVNGWENLASGTGFQFFANAKLSDVNGFQNMTSGVTFVDIRTNPMLSVCCWALPAITEAQANSGTVSISGNAAGCASLAQIDQDPELDSCPSNVSVSTSSSNCIAEISFTDPTITDNCGYTSYTYLIEEPGSVTNSGNAVEGESFPYFFGPGINTITWEVTDESGNSDICVTTITVEDGGFPVFTSELPATAQISTSATSCEGTHSLTFPPATDNCEINYREISVYIEGTPGTFYLNTSPQEGQTYDIELEPGEYTVEAKVRDASGKIDRSLTELTVSDNTGPQYTSAVPGDVTVQVEAVGCSVDHEIIFPQFDDNCGIESASLIVLVEGTNEIVYSNSSPVGGSSYIVSLEPGEYWVEYYLIDENENENDASSDILVVDGVAPVITLNQSDVTVSCNETPPSIPQIGTSVFATDACEGDVTNLMTMDDEVTSGDCMNGGIREETTYTYTAVDSKGNMSAASFKVTIVNDEAIDLGEDIIGCEGDEVELSGDGLEGDYLWSNGATSSSIMVSSAGTYSVTVTGTSGCCSIDEVNVSFQSDPDAEAVGGVLGCTTTEIQLMGSSSTAGVSYSWTGPGGFTSSSQNPTVTSLGSYILTVITAAGCSNTAIAEVTADTDVPDAEAEGGVLNCSVDEVQLSGNSSTSGVSYSWTGPNGFTSSEQNPTVSLAGTYSLTVSAENGCSISVDAEVIDDTTPPIIELEEGEINCLTPEIKLIPEIEGEVDSYDWSGPGGFSSSEPMITVMEGGQYELTVTGTNTCSASTNVLIAEDTVIPDIQAEGGMIDCSSSQVTLMGSSSTANVSFSWSGPDGFAAAIANPVIVTTGTYTLTVIAPNGCEAMETVEVTSDTELPTVTATGGTIDCINTSIDLEATSETEGLTYSWTGPGEFAASTAIISVTEPGTYTVIVTNESGCAAQANVEVIDNSDPPTISTSIDQLNCANPTSEVEVSDSDDVVSYSWTGPEGFTSSQKAPLIETIGTYELVVTSANGCTASSILEVTGDFVVPDADATGGSLSCEVNSIALSGSSTTEGVSFTWTGPDDYTSDEQNPEVSQAGTYILTVTGENGCEANAEAEIIADTDLPDISATGGELNCSVSEVTLEGSSETAGVTLAWIGPDNFSSSEANVTVSAPGEYIFKVTSESGCEAFKVVNVTENYLAPNVELGFADVSCEEGTIEIAPSAIEGLSFEWTGPEGFSSELTNPAVAIEGTYMVTVTGENGCTTDTTIVLENNVAFEINVTVDTTSALIDITGGFGPFEIMWDDGTMSTTATELAQGTHTVTVTDIFGCSQVQEFSIITSSVEDEISLIDFQIAPNPAQERIYLKWDKNKDPIQSLTIYNQSGSEVMQYREVSGLTEIVIELDQFTAGIYFIKILGRNFAGTEKFIKI